MSRKLDDRELLADYEKQMQMVTYHLENVIEGRATGLYLWGAGGIGKSYHIINHLENNLLEEGKHWLLHNTSISGRGLFDILCDHPNSLHIIEDAESMFTEKNTADLLRSATWGNKYNDQPFNPRKITWIIAKSRGGSVSADFIGGLIFTCNSDVPNTPAFAAQKQRFPHLELRVSEECKAALMRSIASRGYAYGFSRPLTPEECQEVADYIITKSAELNRPLDLRMLKHGFKDYQTCRDAKLIDWRDVVVSRIQETTAIYKSRRQIITEEAAIAREIAKLDLSKDGKLDLWRKRTQFNTNPNGKSQAAFYRQLKK